jgi:hypothetical protein
VKDQPDYEVGYGKPPKHSQFPKGKSGNPKGRPKKEKSIQELIQEELKVEISINGNKMTKARAIAVSLVNDSIKGKASARQALLPLIPNSDDACEEFDPELADQIAMMKAMRRWENRTTEEPS